MPVTAVVGAQWGDEGKGKIVDWLAEQADMVIRFQGGNNAGHTVVNDLGEFRLHIVPCGIFNPKTTCIIGTGTVSYTHLDVYKRQDKGFPTRRYGSPRICIKRGQRR